MHGEVAGEGLRYRECVGEEVLGGTGPWRDIRGEGVAVDLRRQGQWRVGERHQQAAAGVEVCARLHYVCEGHEGGIAG